MIEDWRCLIIVLLTVFALFLATDGDAAELERPKWRTYQGTGAEEIRNRRLDYWSDKYIESTQPRGRRDLAIDRFPENWEQEYERQDDED